VRRQQFFRDLEGWFLRL